MIKDESNEIKTKMPTVVKSKEIITTRISTPLVDTKKQNII
jgi:hypothetical protein